MTPRTYASHEEQAEELVYEANDVGLEVVTSTAGHEGGDRSWARAVILEVVPECREDSRHARVAHE
jgi:hypothetical protein